MRNVIALAAAGFVLAACSTPSAREQTTAAPKIIYPVADEAEPLHYSADTPKTSQITDEQAFASARAAVLAHLKDPDSAKFGAKFLRKVVAMTDSTFAQPGFPVDRFTDIVCGTVNAKNGFGGYTGAAIFAYRVGRHDVFIDESSRWNWGGKWCVEAKERSAQ